MILPGYKITIETDHIALTDLFKGRNLSGKLARWYLTIQAYNPEIKYIKWKTNVVADALSRNIPVGAVTDSTTMHNFNIEELYAAQRDHHMWKRVIYALKSGDETDPFFFLSLFFFYTIGSSSRAQKKARYLLHLLENT